MKKNYFLLMLLLVSCFGWQASAQNGGDTCADAIAIDCGSSSIGDSTDATNTDAPT